MKQKDKFLCLWYCLVCHWKCGCRTTGVGLYSRLIKSIAEYTVKITGQVIDPNGEPIWCYSNGKRNHQHITDVTDLDGNFSLTVFPSHRLQISYVGFKLKN